MPRLSLWWVGHLRLVGLGFNSRPRYSQSRSTVRSLKSVPLSRKTMGLRARNQTMRAPLVGPFDAYFNPVCGLFWSSHRVRPTLHDDVDSAPVALPIHPETGGNSGPADSKERRNNAATAGKQWGGITTRSPAPLEEETMNTVTPEEVGLSSTRLEHLRTAAQGYVDQGKLAGLITLVARRGKVAHFECYGMMDIEANKPMQPDTIFRIYSMTKPITCFALMMLIEEGRVLLYDPVSKFILSPQMPDNANAVRDRRVN